MEQACQRTSNTCVSSRRFFMTAARMSRRRKQGRFRTSFIRNMPRLRSSRSRRWMCVCVCVRAPYHGSTDIGRHRLWRRLYDDREHHLFFLPSAMRALVHNLQHKRRNMCTYSQAPVVCVFVCVLCPRACACVDTSLTHCCCVMRAITGR